MTFGNRHRERTGLDPQAAVLPMRRNGTVRRGGLLVALALALGLAVPAASRAGSPDHERARAAMEAGEIMPLHGILAKIDDEFDGRVIEVKLTDLEAGLHGWIYAITLLTPQDNVLILNVDAGTGVLLRVEGHGIEEARKAQ